MSLEKKIDEEWKEIRNLYLAIGFTGIATAGLIYAVPDVPTITKYQLAVPIVGLPIGYYIHRKYCTTYQKPQR
jgi:hypothetical protein